MLFYNNFLDTLTILFVYMFIYNVSLLLIFWTLQQFTSFNLKTLYSFNDLKFNFFFIITFSIILFSIAGVPPFIGFFSKLLILLLLLNSSFFFFYIFFFILLFFGLYFYLQNIKFLHSTGVSNLNYAFNGNLRLTPIYVYFILFFLFFLIFGFFYLDDIILYFYWIFS